MRGEITEMLAYLRIREGIRIIISYFSTKIYGVGIIKKRLARLLWVPTTYNIYFRGEIRKISTFQLKSALSGSMCWTARIGRFVPFYTLVVALFNQILHS